MTDLNTIDEAIEDLKQGKIMIVVDDADRENEGDMILAGGDKFSVQARPGTHLRFLE
jgi:3,4-dihydroxy-2-butanone 4-phosphate synthase